MSLIRTYKRLEEYINTPTIYDLDPYYQIVKKINSRFQEIEQWTESELKTLNYRLKSKISGSAADEEDIIEAFALIKVLAKRMLGLEAYDVQLIAGLVIYEGRIAEMKTGEGKTLAALFPTYLRAIEGQGIHIHTFNDYLSQRDHDSFQSIFKFLDLSTSCITEGMEYGEIETAFNTDVTYGSAKQFLYTFLKQSVADPCYDNLREKYQYAIIDEADAILLDEATNPFVIAGNQRDFNVDFHQIAKAVKLLTKADLFEYTEFKRGVFLNDKGIQFMEVTLGISELYHEANVNVLSAINLSLHAHILLKRDEDYIVYQDEIVLVDEFTGRIVMDRKWRNGLQTAVEAKENLPLKSEGSILNSISILNFYKEYHLMSAMTATAQESATELDENYGLVLVVIPPNIPSQRDDLETRVFRTRELKHKAVIDKILELHKTDRPILIGTQHVSESEWIYEKLEQRGIKCNILNAKNDHLEANVIAKAGMLKAITISTNMAGRGTDIKLGGEQGIAKKKIQAMGGLFVLGTNMHRSGRIDRQLKGRAARQGEEGASQFFVSLEDELFDENKMHKILPKKFKSIAEDEIKDKDILRYLIHAQEVAEDQDNLMRSSINKYSEISYYQSQIIAQWKKEIWKRDDMEALLKHALVANIAQKWASNISQLYELKDGIHFVSLGGQNPLTAYRIIADNFFKQLKTDLADSVEQIEQAYLKDKGEFALLTQSQKPSSTWTYTVSDKGFNSGLEALMNGNSNIAFQMDLLGLTALFFKYGWLKCKQLFNLINGKQWK